MVQSDETIEIAHHSAKNVTFENGSTSAVEPPAHQADQADTPVTEILNPNSYASKKSLAQGMLDLALLAANAAQLKYILTNWDLHDYSMLLLCLVITSIVLQVAQAVICVILTLIFDINKIDQQKGANITNNISLCIVILVVAINVVISAFDVKDTEEMARSRLNDSSC